MVSASEIERVRHANGDPYQILNVAPGTADAFVLHLAKICGAMYLHPSRTREPGAMEAMQELNHAFDVLMALPPGQKWTASRPNGTRPPQRLKQAEKDHQPQTSSGQQPQANETQKRREEEEFKAARDRQREEEKQERQREQLKKKNHEQQYSDRHPGQKGGAKQPRDVPGFILAGVGLMGFVYTIRCFSRPPQELAKGVKDMFFLLDVVEAVCMSQIVGTAVVGIAACKIGRSGDVGLLMGTVCGMCFYLRNVGRKVLRASS
ncbi:unnamed protein product [Tilletia laevis]|uniref:J domain-containing protein n=4 Tax=Tilletia TaxID=13289 RepID=A0A8X7MJ30_9BASI|nr:hypothetical protein CF336_g9449 [Tilletia laevis]KAE8180654.1 hypothetical protein CF328_g9093 [Tilletia controversa]CAD6887866.1 unnamed protein product [Tilletia caries]KAE8180324.1 hypothetical protein CF335_g9290 [Tilletia laevis]KAE8237507.1 hypothetical protein A4X06_0g9207 [Tilletia controversa]